jgi:acetoin utilization protein AcuB
MMHVQDLMQKDVATLQVADHLDLASDIMELGRIRHMPVLEGDKVVGVVSQRDLFRAGISSVLQFRPTTEREWLAKISVREVMVKPVTTVSPGDSLRKAVDLMLRYKIGVIDGFRWATIGGPGPGIEALVSLASCVLLLVSGTIYFRRVERRLADRI